MNTEESQLKPQMLNESQKPYIYKTRDNQILVDTDRLAPNDVMNTESSRHITLQDISVDEHTFEKINPIPKK